MNIEAHMQHEQVTVRHGYWFYFDDGGLKITAFGSGMSGKEIIFVGDEAVSSKRAIRFRSKHIFDYGGNRYEVEFVIKTMLTGELECVLSKNGAVIQRATKAYLVKDKTSARKFGSAVVQGMLIGVLLVYLTERFLWK